MSPIFIANWKMNFLFDDALKTIQEIYTLLKTQNELDKLVIAPPLAYLSYMTDKYPQINYAAQDISLNKEFGAYTAEISAKMIKSAGANYAIIGHSDRRLHHNETSNNVRIKAENCIEAGVIPIICVGEPLESRQQKQHLAFVSQQIKESFPKISASSASQIIIAYEPIWAIGSNTIPTTTEIAEIARQIKDTLDASMVAKNISLVYGGSVNSSNCQEILKTEGISGLLIGSAALNPRELLSIIKGS